MTGRIVLSADTSKAKSLPNATEPPSPASLSEQTKKDLEFYKREIGRLPHFSWLGSE